MASRRWSGGAALNWSLASKYVRPIRSSCAPRAANSYRQVRLAPIDVGRPDRDADRSTYGTCHMDEYLTVTLAAMRRGFEGDIEALWIARLLIDHMETIRASST